MQEKAKRYLDLLYDEPFKIGHWVGFKDLTVLHNEWLRSFLYSDDNQTLLGHRGSYKTSILSLFLAIHAVEKPNENIIFFRKTDTDVVEVIKQSSKILQSPVMLEIVKGMYGLELVLSKNSYTEIHTNLCTSAKGASQIIGLGINTSITGKHADIVITDDIVNLKDRISRAEREHTKSAYMELQNIVNRGGRFINTGTPWHKDDAISLMPNVQRYDCYSTGLISRDKLEELRNSMTDSLFAANYELKHIAEKDAIFAEPRFTTNAEGIYNGIAHIDASYGGSDGTAFTIMSEYKDGYIGLGKRWDKHVDDCLDEILSLCKRYRAGTIYCERNADKGYLAKEIEKKGHPVKTYHEKMNKFVKITTYLKRDWGNIKWLEETDPNYINEILDYTEFAEHDDAPDSAASILRKLSKRATFSFE